MCCPVYREVITNVRCRRAQYTLTATCIFDKIRSIKRVIHSGGLGLEDCKVGTAWGLEDLRAIWLVVLLSAKRMIDRSLCVLWLSLYADRYCIILYGRNADRYRLILYGRNDLRVRYGEQDRLVLSRKRMNEGTLLVSLFACVCRTTAYSTVPYRTVLPIIQ